MRGAESHNLLPEHYRQSLTENVNTGLTSVYSNRQGGFIFGVQPYEFIMSGPSEPGDYQVVYWGTEKDPFGVKPPCVIHMTLLLQHHDSDCYVMFGLSRPTKGWEAQTYTRSTAKEDNPMFAVALSGDDTPGTYRLYSRHRQGTPIVTSMIPGGNQWTGTTHDINLVHYVLYWSGARLWAMDGYSGHKCESFYAYRYGAPSVPAAYPGSLVPFISVAAGPNWPEAYGVAPMISSWCVIQYRDLRAFAQSTRRIPL